MYVCSKFLLHFFYYKIIVKAIHSLPIWTKVLKFCYDDDDDDYYYYYDDDNNIYNQQLTQN
jgi:hypothetical protein